MSAICHIDILSLGSIFPKQKSLRSQGLSNGGPVATKTKIFEPPIPLHLRMKRGLIERVRQKACITL